jgi:cytochrome c oxidase subunit II
MRRRGAARLAIAAIPLLGAVACSTHLGVPQAGTQQGDDTFGLWTVFVIAAAFVAAIVYGLIAWCVVRYRRRRSDGDAQGAQFRANIPIEVLYTALPVMLATSLFLLTVRTEDRVDDVSANPDVVLGVHAFTWGWRFSYEGQGVVVLSNPSGEGIPGPQIELPLDRTARVVLTSDDVIHAFWVPGFLFKRDAIPGRTNVFDVTPTRLGTYRGECAEFCGLNHAYMTFSIRVVPASTYAAWLAEQRSAAAP